MEKYELLREKELSEQLLGEEVEALKNVWQIDLNELELVNKVDEGAFGEVWKAHWDGVNVAVKFMKFAEIKMGELLSINEFDKELDFLRRTRHPHLVRFFGTGRDPHGSPFLVLELVSFGSLNTILRNGLVHVFDRCDPQHVIPLVSLQFRLAHDIASGMHFLHSKGVLHRDLKSGNVLVSNLLRAKITDFGSMRDMLSRNLVGTSFREDSAAQEKNKEEISNLLSVNLTTTMTAGVGTPAYMAPEVLEGSRNYTRKADVYSYGVILWEIKHERTPDLVKQEVGNNFTGPFMVMLSNLLQNGKTLIFQPDVMGEGEDWFEKLADECFLLDAVKRPSFEHILEVLESNSSQEVLQNC
eukprot:m.114496 g.114496  ORF g.114496 m.114496 type:complete len:356 (+) comp9279_c2_seq19:3028-4095(+)